MIVASSSWMGTISLDPRLVYSMDRSVADPMAGEPLLAVFI